MKFDTARVTETIDRLREQVGAGSEGTSRVDGSLAERFEAIGWHVERSTLVWSRPFWTAPWRWPGTGTSPMLVARPRGVAAAPVRVILAAQPCSGRKSRRAAGQSGRLETRDLSGPAFLLELARSWPQSRAERMETVVVAATGESPGGHGSRELLRRVQSEGESKPTLLLAVYGPGLGRNLVVDAFLHRQLVKQSAEGLWVPIRLLSPNPFSAKRARWPFKASFPDQVTMAGEGCFGSTDQTIDPAALHRAYQLVSEIVLRWAGSRSEQTTQPCGQPRTASRSSQKPG